MNNPRGSHIPVSVIGVTHAPEVGGVAVIGRTYPPVLDHRCLSCLQELSDTEKAYWTKRYADDRGEPSILRVSCVQCLRRRGKFIPNELQAVN